MKLLPYHVFYCCFFGGLNYFNQICHWSMIADVLIAFYQKNECLWNHNTPEYHQVRHKELLYDILVKELDIKKKWKQLWKHFREEHAKVQIKPSGAGTNEIYKPSWDFYEQLQFVTVVCDYTDETTDSLTSEPKPKSRKLSKQQNSKMLVRRKSLSYFQKQSELSTNQSPK